MVFFLKLKMVTGKEQQEAFHNFSFLGSTEKKTTLQFWKVEYYYFKNRRICDRWGHLFKTDVSNNILCKSLKFKHGIQISQEVPNYILVNTIMAAKIYVEP